jgi:hypothetical protein
VVGDVSVVRMLDFGREVQGPTTSEASIRFKADDLPLGGPQHIRHEHVHLRACPQPVTGYKVVRIATLQIGVG